MALELPFNIKPINPTASLDERFGPHDSIQDALTATFGTREKGLIVGILFSGKVLPYWFQEGITDNDLVPFVSGNTIIFSTSTFDNNVGNDGDVWWRTSTNQIYQKESGAYVLKLTIESSSGGGLTEQQVQGLIDASIVNFETTTQLNARDTANRNRSNHTGQQAISTITDLQDVLNNKLETINLKTINNQSLVGVGNIDTTPIWTQSDW